MLLFFSKTKITVALFYNKANVTFKCFMIGLQFNTKQDTNGNRNQSTSPHHCSLKSMLVQKIISEVKLFLFFALRSQVSRINKEKSLFLLISGTLLISLQRG